MKRPPGLVAVAVAMVLGGALALTFVAFAGHAVPERADTDDDLAVLDGPLVIPEHRKETPEEREWRTRAPGRSAGVR